MWMDGATTSRMVTNAATAHYSVVRIAIVDDSVR